MQLIELVTKSGFASSRNEARRLIEQCAVRFGLEMEYQAHGNVDDWERKYVGQMYIEEYEPITDPRHEITDPGDWDGWYLFVGKRRVAHLPAIIGGKLGKADKMILDIRMIHERIDRDENGVLVGYGYINQTREYHRTVDV